MIQRSTVIMMRFDFCLHAFHALYCLIVSLLCLWMKFFIIISISNFRLKTFFSQIRPWVRLVLWLIYIARHGIRSQSGYGFTSQKWVQYWGSKSASESEFVSLQCEHVRHSAITDDITKFVIPSVVQCSHWV